MKQSAMDVNDHQGLEILGELVRMKTVAMRMKTATEIHNPAVLLKILTNGL
jgi:hypothetical protein